MGQKFAGYRRLTHTYSEGWSHLDKHEYVGEFKLLNSPRHMPPTLSEAESGDQGTYLMAVSAPRGVKNKVISEVLQDEFTSGCRCEHDCCGHIQRSAGVPRKTNRRTWIVPVRVYRNV
jgi:hypothetical protein